MRASIVHSAPSSAEHLSEPVPKASEGQRSSVKETLGGLFRELGAKVRAKTKDARNLVGSRKRLVEERGAEVGLNPPVEELSVIEKGIGGAGEEFHGEAEKISGGVASAENSLGEPQAEKIKKLQTEINNRHYSVRLDIENPPEPLRGNSIEPVLVQKWIEAHPEGSAREAAQAIIDSTKHYSYGEFKAGLEDAVVSINESLSGREYTIVTPGGKSNKWVTELAIPTLDHLPAEVANQGARDLPGTRFVFIDDALYSGGQMIKDIDQTLCTLRDHKIKMSAVEIYVVAPFATAKAVNGITEGVASNGAKIIFSEHTTMPSIAESISSPATQDTLRQMFGGRLEERTLTFFDHKIPDGRSTLNKVYEEGVVKDQTGVILGEVPFVPVTREPYNGAGVMKPMIEDIEEAMKSNGKAELLVENIPDIGKFLKDKIAFLTTDRGDFLAVKDTNTYGFCVNVSRGGEIIPFVSRYSQDSRPSTRLEKGDQILVYASSLEPPIQIDYGVEFGLKPVEKLDEVQNETEPQKSQE